MSDNKTILDVIIDATGAKQGARTVSDSFEKMKRAQADFNRRASVTFKNVAKSATFSATSIKRAFNGMFRTINNGFKALLRGVQFMAAKIKSVVNKIWDNINFSKLFSKIKSATTAIVTSVTSAFVGLFTTGAAFDKFGIALQVVFDNAKLAREELGFLIDTSLRLGINFSAAVVPFTKFVAAAQGLLSLKDIRNVFVGFAEAASALQLSKEEITGVFLAIQQIASKGIVSMEELRLQMAERIPGAMALAAKAWGTTFADFERQVQLRLVPAGNFLRKFAVVLSDRFGAAAAEASILAANSLNRLKTAFQVFVNTIADEGFMDSMSSIFTNMSEWFKENIDLAKRIGKELGLFFDKVANFVKNIKPEDIKKIFDRMSEGFKSIISSLEKVAGFAVFISDWPVIQRIFKGWGLLIGKVSEGYATLTDNTNAAVAAMAAAAAATPITLVPDTGDVPKPSEVGKNIFFSSLMETLNAAIVDARLSLENLFRVEDLQDDFQTRMNKIKEYQAEVAKITDTSNIEDQIEKNKFLPGMYKDQAKLLGDIGQQLLVNDKLTNIEKIETFKGLLDQLADANLITPGQYTDQLNKFKGELNDVGKEFKQLQRLIDRWGLRVADTFADLVVTGKASFKDLVDSILIELTRLVIFKTTIGPLFDQINKFIPSGRPSTEPISPFTPSAKGNVFAFANGGIIRQKVQFPISGGTGIAGERGTEAIMPLTRLPSGDLGIKAAANDSGTIVNVIDQRGTSAPDAEITQSRTSDGRKQISILIKNEVESLIGAGSLDRSLSRNFGLSRRGV